jgi:energy-coupling factor transport system permease protein
MTYQRRSSPLHRARAACACVYCLALALAAVLAGDPIVLGVVVLAVVAAGVGAKVAGSIWRAALFALPLALLIAVVNALVTRNGLTVILRLGDLPVLGHTDVTLEAVAYGGVLGLHAAALILCGALYTAAVDPDQVLRLFRRVSFHSALTATLATRMVPVLVRDSRRLADAQRCRPGPPASRLQLMRATTSGVLDRALDVAAALEVRGYGAAQRPPRHRVPLSRHDLWFAGAAAGVVALSVSLRATGVAALHAYPVLSESMNGLGIALCVGLLLGAVVPFVDRKGIGS